MIRPSRVVFLLCPLLGVRAVAAQPADKGEAPAAAPAAPRLADELSGDAKADYLAARALYEDGDFAGALIKFRRAFEQSKNPELLWNMAACEKSLRHYARMLRLLERYEHEAGSGLGAAELERVHQLAATVQSLVSPVEVRVNQPGARVFIDGELVGTSPLAAPVLVDLGQRELRVTKPGFVDHVSALDLSGAQAVRLDVALDKRPTEAKLTVAAPGADTISVDGKSRPGARWQGLVRAGSHAIRVDARDMLPYSTELELRAGEARTLNVTLTPESRGIPLGVWIGGGAAIAAGLSVAAYFLFKPEPTTADPTIGTISPGTVPIP